MFRPVSCRATAGLALLAVGLAPALAQATPMVGTYDVEIYQGYGNGQSTGAVAQANLANPLFGTGAVAEVTYTGALDFNATTNTLGAFFASGGGTYTGLGASASNLLSTSGYTFTTLMSFTGMSATANSGTITHDDGVSVYQGGKTIVDAASPTVSETTAYSMGPGAFNLVYVEANNLPSILTVDVATPAPEPATVAVLGMGLLGLLYVRRSRRA